MDRNGTSTGANMRDYTKRDEMEAFDRLPPPLREVLRNAPFSVSAADMENNHLVMSRLKDEGKKAAVWLAEQLELTYRRKILASS